MWLKCYIRIFFCIQVVIISDLSGEIFSRKLIKSNINKRSIIALQI